MNNKATPAPPSFPALIQTFFAEYITQQRALSPKPLHRRGIPGHVHVVSGLHNQALREVSLINEAG